MSTDVSLLRNISANVKLVIAPTRGERTIARATNVFADIHQDFQAWRTEVSEGVRGETPIGVHEIRYDARFGEIFRSTQRNLEELHLTQEQIVAFVEAHSNWLSRNSHGNFFLFRARKEFLVLRIQTTREDELKIFPRRLADSWIMSAKDQHRIIIPL